MNNFKHDFSQYDFSFGLEDGTALCVFQKDGITLFRKIKNGEVIDQTLMNDYEWIEFVAELRNKYLKLK